MIRFKPDVIITIAWCVFGMVYRLLPILFSEFREVSLILLLIFTRKKLEFSNMHFVCIIFCVFYYLMSVFHEGVINSIQSSVSMISWVITLMVFSGYRKEKNDIKLLFDVVIFTSFIICIIFLFNNKLFSNEIAAHFNNGIAVNRNTVLYLVFPGYLFQLIKISKQKTNKIIDYAILATILFVCIQINSRTMYTSLIVCSLLVFNRQILAMIKRGNVFGTVAFILLIVIAFVLIFSILPEDYISREFTDGFESSDTGRLYLWKEAIGLVDNPLLGKGPSFYESAVSYGFGDYGAHNIFVDLYVSAGIFAPTIFAIILSFFINKNLLISAIIFPAFMTFFVEAGRIFFPYMMLIISWFIVVGSQREGQTIDEYLYDCMNQKKHNGK